MKLEMFFVICSLILRLLENLICSQRRFHVLSYGLGPYFHHELIKCLKRNEKLLLCFNEQTNNQNHKQLHLLVKYWLIEGGNTKNKTISEQLSKVTEELIEI